MYDLAPSDYHLFGPLQYALHGRQFQNNEEMETALQALFRDQPKNSLQMKYKSSPQGGIMHIEEEDFVQK